MKLPKDYCRDYEDIFSNILLSSPEGYYDESALPSYTHNNSLIPWLFWKRIEAALTLAGDIRDKSILDFGCGGGVILRYLSGCGCNISACDKSLDITRQVCRQLNIKAKLYSDLTEIRGRKFDIIFALDVFEHIEDVESVIDGLLDLSHADTRFIISGPTENIWYSLGRMVAGFSGHYHVRDIYAIEDQLLNKGLVRVALRRLLIPFVLFRVSAWNYKGE